MTDRRVTDLSYGHLGEASYDVEVNEWQFSIDPGRSQSIQQILPLRPRIPPSIHEFPDSKKTPSTFARSQLKSLVQSRPETFPANAIASTLAQTTRYGFTRPVGRLLAVGNAVDVGRTLGSRTTTLIATPCGEAGHVLRLIRPRIEKHGWGKQSAARLSLMDAGSLDQGYWIGTGGPILQITFADDGNSANTWLVVRQASVTTIFRPIYDTTSIPAVAPSGHVKIYSPSRIHANPLAVLTAERSGSRGHVDVSFNPWYTRQFVVVDELGSWSIWDIEGRQSKSSTVKLIPGRSANIYDGYVPDPTLKKPDNADGWHQILWVSTVTTIVVCNRRHLAVFDVKARPIRLQSPELLAASNSDWILDLKRSPVDLSHLFVLTSSQIFWLEVLPAGREEDGDIGVRVILSYRHFRDANDKTLSLTILRDDYVTVVISSEKTPLINFYTFSSTLDGLGGSSCQGSLTLFNSLDHQETGTYGQFQTLCFVETPLELITTRLPGPELHYIERGVRFYQILALTSDLGLSSALCSIQTISSQSPRSSILRIMVPTSTSIRSSGHLSSRRVEDDSFIVPDESVDDEELDRLPGRSYHLHEPFLSRRFAQDDPRFKINFRPIFQQAFPLVGHKDGEEIDSAENMTELLESTLDRIHQGRQHDNFAMTTFLELSQSPGYSGNLEQGAQILQNFLSSLQQHEEPDASSTLILSNLTSCPGIRFQTVQDSELPTLLNVYDQVAEKWIASLPLQVSNMTRLAKFKIARKMAVELCLSSIAVSLRNKSSQVTSMPVWDGEEPPSSLNKALDISRESSPAFLSSQIPSSSLQEAGFSLPTPQQTPSVYSYGSLSEQTEDPGILRLRQYAVTIKPKADLGMSTLLSHWPAEPGIDPAKYSWEAIRKESAVDDDGRKNDHRRRREEARRRRRTERFLNRESTSVAEATSQPAFITSGTQPDVVQHAFSSQAIDDIPMTQPDRGAFGSRSAQQDKKKLKKRRAAGF